MIKAEHWDKILLGQLAYEIADRVDNPSKSGIERFVGLEHFISGDLKIKQWGSTANVVSAMKKFQKGDILFARRNAYLKRASMVDFEGVCSGDAFVIREKEDRIFPGFLTFIFNSSSLWSYANSYAAGTMSKRVKWRDLEKYSFKLPPREEQKRISILLWSINDVIEKKVLLKTSLERFYSSNLEEIFGRNTKCKKVAIKDVCKVNTNNLSSNTSPGYRFKYLDIASILAPNIIGDLKEYSFQEAPSRARRVVAKGNIVLSLVRPYFQSFVIIENDVRDLVASTGTAVVDVSNVADRRYVFHSFFTKNFLMYCEQRMNGTNYPAITPNDLKDYELPLPSLQEQVKLGAKLSSLKEIETRLSHEIVKLNEVKNQIINQIF